MKEVIKKMANNLGNKEIMAQNIKYYEEEIQQQFDLG